MRILKHNLPTQNKKEPKRSYTRHIRDITLINGYSSVKLQYLIGEYPGKEIASPPLFTGGGICFLAPNRGNWRDLGFLGVRLGEYELQSSIAEITKEVMPNGNEKCVMKWDLPSGAVIIDLYLDLDGALNAEIILKPTTEKTPASIMCFANPNAGTGAAYKLQNKLTEWNRWMKSSERSIKITRKIQIDLKNEDWLILYDKTYNTNYDFTQKPKFLNINGPCALAYDKNNFSSAHLIPYAKYSIKGYFRVKLGIKKINMKFYDFKPYPPDEVASYLTRCNKCK